MNEPKLYRLVDYSSDEETNLDENKLTINNEHLCNYSLRTNESVPLQLNMCEDTLAPQEDAGSIVDSTILNKDILPLPLEIHKMYDVPETEQIDDGDKHEGRIRSFPHERGVWATYVYVEYPADQYFFEMIEEIKKVSESHELSLQSVDNFHVSLSRTLKLRHHWIPTFISDLRAEISCFFKFRIMFQSIEVYENDEKTRTFLGLRVHLGNDCLLKLAKKVDKCLSEFNLPTFYEDPSFHVSCLSCTGSKAQTVEKFMADINVVFQTFLATHSQYQSFWIDQILCKSGNKLFTFKLKT